MVISVHLDRLTGESAGASGTFQVISATDENDKNLTEHIDQGKHYHSLEQLKSDFEESLGTEVEIEEV